MSWGVEDRELQGKKSQDWDGQCKEGLKLEVQMAISFSLLYMFFLDVSGVNALPLYKAII